MNFFTLLKKLSNCKISATRHMSSAHQLRSQIVIREKDSAEPFRATKESVSERFARVGKTLRELESLILDDIDELETIDAEAAKEKEEYDLFMKQVKQRLAKESKEEKNN